MNASGPVSTVPRHVAIIMDGNNRWARERGLNTSAGHRAGVEAIRGVLEACDQHGVEALTLFAFSSENWQRPPAEVEALMRLFSAYLDRELRKLHKDGIRLRFIGRRDRLGKTLVKKMQQAEQLTVDNRHSTLVIAVDYGGRWDIAQAARRLAAAVARGELAVEAIDEAALDERMALSDLPAPDLCIRTAGEQRVSNFLLWQLAYAEFWFTDTLWPDFDAAHMARALADFGRRERRFGSRSDTVAGAAGIA